MKYISSILLLVCVQFVYAQINIGGQTMPTDNYYTIKDYINTHLRKTTGMTHNEQASQGDHLYDRWLDYWADHIYADGTFPPADHAYQEMLHYKQLHLSNRRSINVLSHWKQIPVNYSSNAPGIGRVDRVDFNRTNPQHLYLSTPTGSLWESLDKGITWNPRTDQLPIIGLSDIVVDPHDTNILYIATGDGESNRDNPSIGVLKSYDAGTSWLTTGLNFTFTTGQKYTSRMEMNPTDPAQLLVATSVGIYRTADSGATFSNRKGGNFRDIKYMPMNGAICYAASSSTFYRSIDSGKTWAAVSAGITSNSDRTSIAVSDAAPARVYLLSGNYTTGLSGVYMSTDTGKTWTTQTTTPNILGYAPDGSDNFSQSWYTLAFAASPLDPNLLFAGGANVWTSTDAGITWNSVTSRFGGFGLPMVHPDIHELHFSPDGKDLYVACDGGLYHHVLNQSTWDYISNGLQNTQVYRIAVSENDTSIVMYGAQDNDVVVGKNGNWDGDNLNADGFGCAIHPTNSSILFGASQYGGINKSADQGTFWTALNIGNQNADWDAPYQLNMNNPNELFAGMDYFYHSTNGGVSWSQMGKLGSSSNLFKAFDFCKANTLVMYATYGVNGLFKTTNGGSTWSNQNSPDIAGVNIKSIAVHPTDPDRVWVTASGYRAGKKVFYSSDGGQSFSNISGTLPNISANTIAYQEGSNDIVYVGMDNGVYVYGDTLSDWLPFYDNLPNAIVKEIKIRYSTNELFAGTYGRGVWRSNLYGSTATGIHDIEQSNIVIYPNPVQDELIINSKDVPRSDAEIKLYTIEGQLIKEMESNELPIAIPCSDMATGVYIVTYEVGGTKTVRRFVKL